jgi:hypothetical protein
MSPELMPGAEAPGYHLTLYALRVRTVLKQHSRLFSTISLFADGVALNNFRAAFTASALVSNHSAVPSSNPSATATVSQVSPVAQTAISFMSVMSLSPFVNSYLSYRPDIQK